MRLTDRNRTRPLLLLLIALVAGVALAGCGAHAGGTLGRLQNVADQCPSGKKVAGFAAIDLSFTGRDPQLIDQRVEAAQSLAELTAICSGHLRVSAFSSSASATVTLYDGELAPEGATQIARLRRVSGIVDDVIGSINDNLTQAKTDLAGNGSDVLAQLGLAKEFVQQLGSGYALRATILSDGIATTGAVNLNVPTLTSAAAIDLGSRVTIPNLAGATVTFAGIGKVASGPAPPTAYIDAVKDFFKTACSRTGAQSCTVVTDIEGV